MKKSRLWTYLKTGGHPYKDAYWRKEYERIARECGVSPDHVYRVAKGGAVSYDADRRVREELKRCGVMYSVIK